MAKILLNALAATAGGGITYLHNVLPRLAAYAGEHYFIVLVPEASVAPWQTEKVGRVLIKTIADKGSLLTRLWWEQYHLRAFLRAHAIEVLVSLGNFALLFAPKPQLLFNRNALYFSSYFNEDLWRRGCYRELVSHRLKSSLARLSINQAQVNATPTAAFAQEIQAAGFSHKEFAILPFGFDSTRFAANQEPLPEVQLAQLDHAADCLRILYVSHYNYFRNFETLLRALPLIKTQLQQFKRRVQLVLTTDLQNGASYGGYDATAASALIDRLGIRSDIAMLGAVDYSKLHQLYRMCDLFVCPSYAESFGHPLLEAMASGLPVLAADRAVHREVCGAAAHYFEVFDERDLAGKCVRLLTEPDLRESLKAHGRAQWPKFTWEAHVSALLGLIDRCLLEAQVNG